MGILTRPLLRPQQRWDLEDFNTALSALRTDSHFYTQRFISDKAYILQGFAISQGFIGQPTADVSLTNATLVNADNTGDVSWWTAPASADPLTLPTGVNGLQGGRNYVELEIYSQDGTPLQRAFWDPSANSGAGVEFSQNVNTVTELFIRAVVNQTGFNTGNPNRIPLAIIDLDGSLNIRGIKDKRNLMFRLGKPSDVHAEFVWGSREEAPTTLVFVTPSAMNFILGEEVTFSSGATAVCSLGGTNNVKVFDFSTDNINPGDLVTGTVSGATATLQSYYESFSGSDKDIRNYRDMFAALMTEIKTVKGTNFWYEIGTVSSLTALLNLFNSRLVPMASGARFAWSGSALTITDNKTSSQASSDVVGAIRIPGYGGDVLITRQDGTGGSASLSIPDQSVLYVELPDAGSSRTYSESGPGVSNYKIVSRTFFVPSDKNYVLAYREGTQVVVTGLGELKPGEETEISNNVSKDILAFIGAESESSTNPQYTTLPSSDLSNQFTTNDSLTQSTSINAANINDIAAAVLKPYQEALTVVSGIPVDDTEVQGPITAGDTLTLPLDSRDSGAERKYKVGQGGMFVFLNGQHLRLGEDYTEVGTSGSLSNEIMILQDLVIDDVLEFKLINPQFFGTAGADQPFFVNYLIGQNGAQVPVGALYNTGTDRLQVWRSGLAMIRTSSVGDLIDRYQETSNNSISVSETANPDEVFVMVNHEAPNPTATLITGVTGAVLTIPTYTMGNGELRIFRNGVLLSTNVGAPTDLQYSETSTTSVTLAMAATVTDVFKVYKAGAAPTFRESITGVTGLTITIPNSQTYTPGSQKLLVFRNGLLMNKSAVIGEAVERYAENGNDAVDLEVAAVPSDLFEFIYV